MDRPKLITTVARWMCPTGRCVALFALALFAWCPAQAATVTGLVQLASRNMAAGQKVTFTPTNTPLVGLNNAFTLSDSVTRTINNNGVWSATLEAGYYWVDYPLLRDRKLIAVPDSTDTYDWLTLISGTVTSITSVPTVFIPRAAGTGYSNTFYDPFLILPNGPPTNLWTVFADGTTGQLLWGLPSSGSGTGEVTTVQLNIASNAAVNTSSNYTWAVSNYLYGLINAGGITAAEGTNIAQFFATNSAIITSNALLSLSSAYTLGVSNNWINGSNTFRADFVAALAYTLGVSNNWINGSNTFRADIVAALAYTLGVSNNWINGSNTFRTDISNLQGASNSFVTLSTAQAITGAKSVGTLNSGTQLVMHGQIVRPPQKLGNGVLTVTATNFYTLTTNASFAVSFSGQTTNGQLVTFVVSNHASAANIIMTNTTGIFDFTVRSNVNEFAISSNSIAVFNFRFLTNFVGGGAWYLEQASAFSYAIVPGSYMTWSTNGDIVTLNITGVQPTNANLTTIGAIADPDADKVLGWDDSAGQYILFSLGSGLASSGTALTASGSGSSSFNTTNLYVTNSGVFVADLANFDRLKVYAISNGTVHLSNASSFLKRGRALIQQSTNGGAMITWTAPGGLLQTNGNIGNNTNASALDVLEFEQSFFDTNLFAWWPSNFMPRVAYTNVLGTGGGGGGGSCATLSLDRSGAFADYKTFAAFYSYLATSFTTGGSGFTVCKAQLFLDKQNSPTEDLTVEIWTRSGSNPLAIVGTGSAAVNAATLLSGTASYIEFTGINAVLSSGTDYFVVLRATGAANDVRWSGATSAELTRGSQTGSAWDNTGPLALDFKLFSE